MADTRHVTRFTLRLRNNLGTVSAAAALMALLCMGVVAPALYRAGAVGAGELLVTDVTRDGSGLGLNVELGRAIADAVDIPVILSGGCGIADHFVQGFKQAHAEAVAAGTFFCFRDQNPMQARAHVRSAGIPIRVET